MFSCIYIKLEIRVNTGKEGRRIEDSVLIDAILVYSLWD